MVRRRKRSVRIGLVVAACIVAFTAYVVLRASRTRHPARTPTTVPPECRLGPTTPGIDVSYYQGDIAWRRVRRAGVRFAFIRVSDGSAILDTKFEANWRGAQRAGVLRGAYQFFRPEESPIDQANLLIRILRTRGMGELPPVLDLEVTGGLPLATVAANARVWIEHVRSQLGVEPIVYTNPGMWQWRGAGELARQPLWLAHYTTQCPTLPPPWSRWQWWQYADDGHIDGIEGPVDLDVFAGTLDDLRRHFAR
jgi:lysozyme